MISPSNYKSYIIEQAATLGFDYCGFAAAKPLDEDARRLEQWLSKGMQGTMQYMENHFDLRIDPTKLFPGAKTVITLLFNYFPSEKQNEQAPKIAKYAYGEDYHDIIRKKLKLLLQNIKNEIGDIQGRGFVDSAPVLERSWALQSGLGWIGKNGNLINKKSGSFFFIATLITDLKIEPDPPFLKDYCGTCTACIDHCPTDAILPNKVIDASRCISYFTIELKEALIPENYKGQFEDWMFGCDICQDVCPWNRFSKPHQSSELKPIPEILNLSNAEWEAMTEESFNKIFNDSPLKRTQFKGIKRNIRFLRS
ncbi:MAG: tRNA epoxyqueuosine(34) reductase QueG [Bacteroidota bacterium]